MPGLWDGMPPGQFRILREQRLCFPTLASQGWGTRVRGEIEKKEKGGHRRKESTVASRQDWRANAIILSAAPRPATSLLEGCFAMFPALRLRRCRLLAHLILISVV